MHDAHGQLPVAEAVHDLRRQPGLPVATTLGTRGLNMLNLALKKVARHFRLDQVIDACAAAAPGALGKF